MPSVKKVITRKYSSHKRGTCVPKKNVLIWVRLYELKNLTRIFIYKMFTFDRDTATIVAVLMCIVATMYMYRELNKTKSEMDNVKGFYGNLMTHLSRPPPQVKSVPVVETEKEEVLETQVDDDEEESSE